MVSLANSQQREDKSLSPCIHALVHNLGVYPACLIYAGRAGE
jgi:hypothetical protein